MRLGSDERGIDPERLSQGGELRAARAFADNQEAGPAQRRSGGAEGPNEIERALLLGDAAHVKDDRAFFGESQRTTRFAAVARLKRGVLDAVRNDVDAVAACAKLDRELGQRATDRDHAIRVR